MTTLALPSDFTHQRVPGEVDLIAAVTDLLRAAHHPAPEQWLSDPAIASALGAGAKLQQFLINRYWRLQLGACESSTTAERYCLVDEGTPKDYLSIFEKALVPAILRERLPR